jgi:tetratricopeptide (TPR) repeat protein
MSGMRVLRRLFARHSDGKLSASSPPARRRVWSDTLVRFARPVPYGGRHDLEIVGESNYQDALWRAAGGRTTDRIRVEIRAILADEPDNPYDPSAISVWIDERKVGYLCREDAEAYLPGLLNLQEKEGGHIALNGVVTGGGVREDGPGLLGVWLYCDPADFDVEAIMPPPTSALRATMRTGLTEALLTDEGDDSYDLSWLQRLPSDHIAAIGRLRQLLREDPDPIDRHFMFCELEERLYRSRDAFGSALGDYDAACALHDAEMDGIRDALLSKFGKVPLLETYRQMAVRQQKAKNWAEALRWAERGLALYGDSAARPEAVDDLKKRVAAYSAKLKGEVNATPRRVTIAPGQRFGSATETLTCESCRGRFVRPLAPGRKPRLCPACRS